MSRMSITANAAARFGREKKKLVPARTYIDSHPLNKKYKKAFFKASLKHQGHDASSAFDSALQTPIRTVVSKTYTDMYGAFRQTCIDELTQAEREQHLDWMFEILFKYQEDAKALILKHVKEMDSRKQ